MILIVVVGLMALFALVGITFVITAEQANRASQSAAEVGRFDDPPETLLERAFLQVLVGSKNRFSSIGPNSLLEDMYGPGLIAAIPPNGFAPGDAGYVMGQLSGGTGAGAMMYFTGLQPRQVNGPFSNQSGAYSGNVITMLTGRAAGKSSRITGYTVTAATSSPFKPVSAVLRMLPFPGMTLDTSSGGWAVDGAPQVGDLFLINSRPFNGTGAGYRPGATATSGLLDHPLTTLPHSSASNADLSGAPFSINGSGATILAALAINARDPEVRRYMEAASAAGRLHLDQDYDAPDYQNPHLALLVNSTNGNFVASPSYHRPDVLYYYSNLLSAGMGPESLMNSQTTSGSPLAAPSRRVFRKLTPRPLKQDHPGMYGVNPNFSLDLRGVNPASMNAYDHATWDVDNDGDGVPDSVWIDAGFDVQSDAQGRMYKPLVAIYCRDLDGKLNLNAHGQNNDYAFASTGLHQVHTAKLQRPNGTEILPPAQVNPTSTVTLTPTGGMSPADVSLAPLFSWPFTATAASEFLHLLHGRIDNGQRIQGRYGEAPTIQADPLVGNYNPSQLAGPGVSRQDDNYPPDAMNAQNYAAPNRAFPANGNSLARYANGTPLDYDSNGAIAVGFDGQPLFYSYGTNNGSLYDSVDEAFEINLHSSSRAGSPTQSVDAPFAPNDLEWLLRRHDVDQPEQKSRLAKLIQSFSDNAYARSLATTESWDVPTPSIQCTPEIRAGLLLLNSVDPNYDRNIESAIVDPTISDLIRGKIAIATQLAGGTPNADQVDHLTRMYVDNINGYYVVAPELLIGTRININRPLGNNYDDNNNGVVDEPAEAGAEELWAPTVQTDRNGDGVINAADQYPGLALARHLYFLTMLLTDWKYAETSQEPGGINETERRELTIRRIAQWAVNVADARDPDLIMTPFEYDANPWNGWDVDGAIGTVEPDTSNPTNPHPDRRVVWGCETPVLLLTETAAFHDVRVKDTNNEAGGSAATTGMGPMDDTDPDQFRIPQGSAFIELHCPLSQEAVQKMMQYSRKTMPDDTSDLFVRDGAQWKLDLGRPGVSGGEGRHPTWRMVVSETGLGTAANVANQQVNARLKNFPDSASLEVEPFPGATNVYTEPAGSMTFSNRPGGAAAPVKMDRVVWFRPFDGAAASIGGLNLDEDYAQLIYANRSNRTVLEPGGYAVVGPQRSDDFGGTLTRIGYSSTALSQRLDCAASFVASRQSDAGIGDPYDPPGTKIKPAVGIPCAWLRDFSGVTGSATLGPIGFSVSEPRPRFVPMTTDINPSSYYRATAGTLQAVTPVYNGGGPGNAPDDMYNPPLDDVEDARPNFPLVDAGIINTGAMGNLLDGAGILKLHENFKTVFLQRLANPLVAYSSQTNPYITVDWMDIDLRVFNGEDGKWSNQSAATQNDGKFCSRQRGGDSSQDEGGATGDANGAYPIDGTAVQDWTDLTAPAKMTSLARRFDLWYNRSGLAHEDAQSVGTNHFSLHMSHTLGYLNRTYHSNSMSMSSGMPMTADQWFYQTNIANRPELIGQPFKPFRWLPTFNRPFISPMELLLVPSSSPSRLGWECAPFLRSQPADQNFYAGRLTFNTNSEDTYRSHGPFGHLLNFFYSAETDADYTSLGSSAQAVDGAAPNYHRILEYVHVPSRFSGSHEVLDPTIFQAGSAYQKMGMPNEFYPFYAPFNLLPTYREPGRVNLNTTFDMGLTTWLSVTNAYGDRNQDGVEDLAANNTNYATTWRQLFRSRKGRALAGSVVDMNLSVDVPSRVNSPFRSFGTSGYVPLIAGSGAEKFTWNEATLLRRTRTLNDETGAKEPLFRFNSHPEMMYSGATLTPDGVIDEFNNSDRNPTFRYELLNKLSNVTTSRSNVYAVWVTVGYFEVERAIPQSPNPTTKIVGANVPALEDENFDGQVDVHDFWTVYPDGYTYKGELGADTGEIKRHRGFWIVDRTIPVGFERGEVHNAMDAVILQRVLE